MTAAPTFNETFPLKFCINLTRRRDRWSHCLAQFARFGIRDVTRIPAIDTPTDGRIGCCMSHKLALQALLASSHPHALVLEDDFLIVHAMFNELWQHIAPYAPAFDLLYLGAHYASNPISRYNRYFIRCGAMLTTVAYAITCEHAARLLPLMADNPNLDTFYGQFAADYRHAVTSPRLVVQRPGHSDIVGCAMNYLDCMFFDNTHESRV